MGISVRIPTLVLVTALVVAGLAQEQRRFGDNRRDPNPFRSRSRNDEDYRPPFRNRDDNLFTETEEDKTEDEEYDQVRV